MTLYALGLKPEEEIKKLMEAAVNKTTVDYDVKNGPTKKSAIWISVLFLTLIAMLTMKNRNLCRLTQ